MHSTLDFSHRPTRKKMNVPQHSAAKHMSLSGSHHSLLFDQGFPNNTQLQRHIAGRNAIWRYFVSMRLYLVMLFILSITLEYKYKSDFKKSWDPLHWDTECNESFSRKKKLDWMCTTYCCFSPKQVFCL